MTTCNTDEYFPMMINLRVVYYHMYLGSYNKKSTAMRLHKVIEIVTFLETM